MKLKKSLLIVALTLIVALFGTTATIAQPKRAAATPLPEKLSATEFSRNLSSCLNEVRYQDMTLEVWRGREMVARVVPPNRLLAAQPEHQNRLQAALSKMEDAQADALLDDLRAVRQVLSADNVHRNRDEAGDIANTPAGS